ncbi:MAG TPA: sulfotransferase [Steroidobacteraceae bacterium]
MPFKWLDAREATAIGNALADDLELRTEAAAAGKQRNDAEADPSAKDLRRFLPRFFQRVDREALPLRLNVFQRAQLANTFKWRLLEKGVARDLVDELTRALVQRLTPSPAAAVEAGKPASPRQASGEVQTLLAKGDACMARRAWAEAADYYENLLSIDSRHAIARNNLGAAFCSLGRYADAEDQFRRAIGIDTRKPDAHNNLGTVLRWRGRVIESETPLRRALKLRPTYVDAQVNLASSLVLLNRWRDAKELLEKALRSAPRNVTALVALGQIAGSEGRLDEAETLFKRAAEIDPSSPNAWAALAGVRKMTPADAGWAKRAEQIADGDLAPHDEAHIRYAIGKYHDDVGDFARAFRSYRRANELQKMAADPYDRQAHERFVDDMKRIYTREALAQAHAGASDSHRPVFVVGMPRSGTSLVEQIIASHPAARGAGELPFWSDGMRRHESTIRRGLPDEALRGRLSGAYLRLLTEHSKDAERIVDKATFNSEYLGVIHSVFPNARFIYLQRDPIDACLSAYFQQLSPEMTFAMDLSDLAHYYRQHQRLVTHWRSALPPGALLDVPYAQLVADQERWTRKIVDFLGLDWNERCLDFTRTERVVMTSSFWQVRQKIYNTSVGRWHNYQKFIGPLAELRD